MVEDRAWQDFATQNRLALLGCYFTDKPHEQMFIEEYANASRGSGQAVFDALTSFAAQSGHPELANARLLLWGMSAGGEFNYEFTAWKPERVIAFVVNKGGIYYSALLSATARSVPGLFFVGGRDIEFRTSTITGLFAVNRRAGARWALAEEPDVGHEEGQSRRMALIFFDDVLSLPGASASPNANAPHGGFLGDLKAKTFRAAGDAETPDYPTAWLPTMRVAQAWQAVVTGKPLEP